MRFLPWVAAAAYFVAAFAWIRLDRHLPRHAFQPFSTHNTSPRGLSLARQYLDARILSTRFGSDPLQPNAVLFRIRPHVEEGTEELLTAEEEEWVRVGGRLVLAVGTSYRGLECEDSGPAPPRKVFPIWPGVKSLQLPAPRVLSGAPLAAAHTVWSLEDGVVVARIRSDRGEVVLLSCPEVFQNEHLARSDHLPLLISLADGRRPVYFDESVHGAATKAGVIDILTRWGFGPFLLLSTVAALVAFWRGRRRLGPAVDDHQERRTEAIDFVDSLAQLYDRSFGRRQVLRLYHEAFARAVSVQLGLRGAALETRAKELLPRLAPSMKVRRDISQHEFRSGLRAVNEAFRRLEDAERPRAHRESAKAPSRA